MGHYTVCLLHVSASKLPSPGRSLTKKYTLGCFCKTCCVEPNIRCFSHETQIQGDSVASPKLLSIKYYVNQLTDNELTTGYYQQDGATCYTSDASMREIESFFQNRIISENLWLPRSPDLTPADFFLWGLLKGKVYKNTASTIEQLKDAIRQEIQAVNVDTLGKVFQNLEKHIQGCLDVKGDQFKHRL